MMLAPVSDSIQTPRMVAFLINSDPANAIQDYATGSVVFGCVCLGGGGGASARNQSGARIRFPPFGQGLLSMLLRKFDVCFELFGVL